MSLVLDIQLHLTCLWIIHPVVDPLKAKDRNISKIQVYSLHFKIYVYKYKINMR